MRAYMPNRGFTLIEMLLAIMIMAFMFAMVYGSINGASNARAAMRDNNQQTHQIQRAMNIIDQDMAQIVARSASRADIGQRMAVKSGAREDGVLLSFNRNAVVIVKPEQQSDLVRVAYELAVDSAQKDGFKLYRLMWRDIDAATELAPKKRLLLQGVQALKFEYMDMSYGWHKEWPLTNTNQTELTWQQAAVLPRAIKMTLTTAEYGAIERVYRIGVAHGF